MIYEIQVRPATNKPMSSDQLIWIETSLPTRTFEQWLVSKSLLNGTSNAPVVRWSVVQSDRPAHFQLETQMAALENRIAELMSSKPELRETPEAASESVTCASVAQDCGAFLNRLARGASGTVLVAAGW
jgi:hypothetical protein